MPRGPKSPFDDLADEEWRLGQKGTVSSSSLEAFQGTNGGMSEVSDVQQLV